MVSKSYVVQTCICFSKFLFCRAFAHQIQGHNRLMERKDVREISNSKESEDCDDDITLECSRVTWLTIRKVGMCRFFVRVKLVPYIL